jgi:rhodanese-related sulfurtransferase
LPIVLDIRSRSAFLRGHRDGAVNIPLQELSARDRAELPQTKRIVVDCFAAQQAGICAMAAKILGSHGFSDVAIVNRRE